MTVVKNCLPYCNGELKSSFALAAAGQMAEDRLIVWSFLALLPLASGLAWDSLYFLRFTLKKQKVDDGGCCPLNRNDLLGALAVEYWRKM